MSNLTFYMISSEILNLTEAIFLRILFSLLSSYEGKMNLGICSSKNNNYDSPNMKAVGVPVGNFHDKP